MEELTDSSLMKLVQAGDSSHLAVLFERHHAGLVSLSDAAFAKPGAERGFDAGGVFSCAQIRRNL